MRKTLLPIWRRPRTKGATEAVYSGATESHQGTWDFLSLPPCTGFCPSMKSTLHLHKESSQKVPKAEENLLYIYIWIHAHVCISVYEERERGARERESEAKGKKKRWNISKWVLLLSPLAWHITVHKLECFLMKSMGWWKGSIITDQSTGLRTYEKPSLPSQQIITGPDI